MSENVEVIQDSQAVGCYCKEPKRIEEHSFGTVEVCTACGARRIAGDSSFFHPAIYGEEGVAKAVERRGLELKGKR